MSDELRRRMWKRIEREVLSEREWQRNDVAVDIPLSAEYLKARADFGSAWKAITAEGERLGYLVWTDDYPGSELEVATHTSVDGGRRFTESEEEWMCRVKSEVARRLARKWKKLLERES